jgi:hypothetical protein
MRHKRRHHPFAKPGIRKKKFYRKKSTLYTLGGLAVMGVALGASLGLIKRGKQA